MSTQFQLQYIFEYETKKGTTLAGPYYSKTPNPQLGAPLQGVFSQSSRWINMIKYF
jgi:hypothetical protein